MYVTGFNSDMEGRKARRVAAVCRERGLASFRFDHRGHGASSGALESGSIGVWFRDARALLRARLRGEIVLVGASMGVWLMLLLARASHRGELGRVRGLVGIGGGADFAERLPLLSAAERQRLGRWGIVWRASRYGDGPYPLTRRMVEDGRRYRVLGRAWNPGCPVHLLHGMKDPDVPWSESLTVAEALRGGVVRVTLIPDGNHRLSRERDLNRLEDAIDGVIAASASG